MVIDRLEKITHIGRAEAESDVKNLALWLASCRMQIAS